MIKNILIIQNYYIYKFVFTAGDNVKFGFPMAYTITTVAWGLIEFGDAYRAANEYNNGLDMIKWATDYFIAAHPSPNELYVQVSSIITIKRLKITDI